MPVDSWSPSELTYAHDRAMEALSGVGDTSTPDHVDLRGLGLGRHIRRAMTSEEEAGVAEYRRARRARDVDVVGNPRGRR